MGSKEYKCPKCGSAVKKSEKGWYCTEHCGMNLNTLYGVRLNDSIITELLYAHEHPECKRRFIETNLNGTRYQIYPIVDEEVKGDTTFYYWYHSPIPKSCR